MVQLKLMSSARYSEGPSFKVDVASPDWQANLEYAAVYFG